MNEPSVNHSTAHSVTDSDIRNYEKDLNTLSLTQVL